MRVGECETLFGEGKMRPGDCKTTFVECATRFGDCKKLASEDKELPPF